MKTTLFHRSGKTVQLTKQGEILLNYAKLMTELVDEASIKIKNISQQESILSVYVSNYIAGYFFTDILKHFHVAFPKQLLKVYTHCYEDLVRCLREGRTNIAFMPNHAGHNSESDTAQTTGSPGFPYFPAAIGASIVLLAVWLFATMRPTAINGCAVGFSL